MAEEIPPIDNVIESHNNYEKVRANFESLEQNMIDSADFSESEIKELEEKINEYRPDYEKASREYVEHRNEWQKGLAEKLGLKSADIDFNTFDFSAPDAKPEIKRYLEGLLGDNLEGLQKLQKYYGEDGRSLRDSPATMQRIKEFFRDPHMRVNIVFLLLDIIGAGVWDSTDVWSKHNPKDIAKLSHGCYQYNMNTGEIKFLGTCGAMSDGSCCSICTTDSDCLSKKSCTSNDQCKNGSCVKGFCQGQTCDNKGDNPTFTCTPCPSSASSIIDQIGSLSICTGSYPSTTCTASGLICQIKTKDKDGFIRGACPSCKDQTDTDKCAESGDEWITNAICSDGLTFISALENMRQYKDTWVPQSVPVFSWIFTVLGMIGFILTTVWYIKYLIKYGKK